MSDDSKTLQSSETNEAESEKSLALFTSEKLFGTENEIGIVHSGSVYRLKITRQGKLILNK